MATGMVCQVSSSVNAPFCKPNPQNSLAVDSQPSCPTQRRCRWAPVHSGGLLFLPRSGGPPVAGPLAGALQQSRSTRPPHREPNPGMTRRLRRRHEACRHRRRRITGGSGAGVKPAATCGAGFVRVRVRVRERVREGRSGEASRRVLCRRCGRCGRGHRMRRRRDGELRSARLCDRAGL